MSKTLECKPQLHLQMTQNVEAMRTVKIKECSKAEYYINRLLKLAD